MVAPTAEATQLAWAVTRDGFEARINVNATDGCISGISERML